MTRCQTQAAALQADASGGISPQGSAFLPIETRPARADVANTPAAKPWVRPRGIDPLHVWHGTTVGALASILREGLRTIDRAHGTPSPFVSFATHPQIALFYARIQSFGAPVTADNRPVLVRVPFHALDRSLVLPERGSVTISAYGEKDPVSRAYLDDAWGLMADHGVVGYAATVAVDPSWVDLSWSGIDAPSEPKSLLHEADTGESAFWDRWSDASTRPAPSEAALAAVAEGSWRRTRAA